MNAHRGLGVVVMVAFLLAGLFFVRAMIARRIANLEGRDPYETRVWVGPTLWGFAFLTLGFLGNHYLAAG